MHFLTLEASLCPVFAPAALVIAVRILPFAVGIVLLMLTVETYSCVGPPSSCIAGQCGVGVDSVCVHIPRGDLLIPFQLLCGLGVLSFML